VATWPYSRSGLGGVILALGASLHAVGEQASIATLITVNALAALIGGAVPVLGLAWMRRREYV
jgi:hypothetical protein